MYRTILITLLSITTLIYSEQPMFNTFKLEDYYGKHEFKTKYMLSSSDAESWSLEEILAMANPEELKLWNEQRFGYTEIWGLPALRERIAQTMYPGLSSHNVLCFAGAEEGVFCALLTLCKPEDHVIVLTPSYQSLTEVPQSIGCEVTSIELKEEEQWRINIAAIEQAIKPNTKVVVINFPHNPTGQVITPEELSVLIALLKKHDIWLFSDEAYRLLGATQNWAQPAACLYDKALSLGVMSKAYGMPGLRIGWIACQNTELLKRIAEMKMYTSLCNSGPAEILSLIALRNSDTILKRNNAIVAQNLMLLDAFFEKYSHLFSWVRPQGGCTGFVKYLGKGTVEDFCQQTINEAQILLLPGSVYTAPSKHFRIGFGRKNMPEALAHFEALITKE